MPSSVDVAPLVFFRVVFGLLVAWHLVDYIQYDWARRVYVDPVLRVPYAGFEWLAPWPGDGMVIHFAVLVGAALAVAAGLRTRLASVVLCLGLAYTFLLERTHSNNHDYLIVLLAFLACWLPLGRAGSRDVRADPSREVDEVPAWTLWLLRGQVAVLYLFGALSKWNADWLQQGEPFGPHVLAVAEAQGWPFAEVLAGREAWVALSWAGMLFDLLVIPGLLWRRTRAAAVVASVLFHSINQVLFPIGIFPMLALSLTFLFLDPAWSRRVLRLGAPSSPPRRWSPSASAQRLVLPALGLWFAVQLIAPLRPWLLSGEPAWTERGTLYSWRMMISRKDCELDFVVTAGDPPRSVPMDWRALLTEDQLDILAGNPELIVWFARELRARAEGQGHGEVVVRANAYCALNGRAFQPLVDPAVDLSRAEGWAWITPLEGGDVP